MTTPPASRIHRITPEDHILFEDKDGKTIKIPASATIKDLVKMGVRKVGLISPTATLKPNEYRSLP